MIDNHSLIEWINNSDRLSIVRCGDGEKIVLDSMSNMTALRLCDSAVMQRQLGYSPPLKHIEEIRMNLISAYAEADIIGVPNHKHATSKHWNDVVNVLDENVPIRTEAKCDIDFAYQMLDDGSYDKFLSKRDVLNYISCRDLDEGFKNRFGIKRVNKYTIAPEKKFVSGYTGEPHYPNQFNKAARWLDVMQKDFPGSLLLVGAGVIGKIYCNWWRDRGGVAVDIGGVMDCFAGFVTRGPEKGLDKVDLTYKL